MLYLCNLFCFALTQKSGILIGKASLVRVNWVKRVCLSFEKITTLDQTLVSFGKNVSYIERAKKIENKILI